VNIKAQAIHIPFHTTWAHEKVSEKESNGKAYKTVSSLRDIIKFLN
jgi:putative hydrolase of the HAD superfamily